jgi:hypothetical protein
MGASRGNPQGLDSLYGCKPLKGKKKSKISAEQRWKSRQGVQKLVAGGSEEWLKVESPKITRYSFEFKA